MIRIDAKILSINRFNLSKTVAPRCAVSSMRVLQRSYNAPFCSILAAMLGSAHHGRGTLRTP